MKDNFEFLNEISLMSIIDCKYLVKCLGGSIQRPHLFVVMPFYKNGSLYDKLHPEFKDPKYTPKENLFETSKGLRYNEILKMGFEISKAIEYLHSLNIIHRDIKSANVLLDEKGGAVLTDFGIMRCFYKSNLRMSRGMGTPRYISNEVSSGEFYDLSADIFSFGMVLYEMTTGLLPFYNLFNGFLIGEAVEKGERPKFSNSIMKTFGTDFIDFIKSCWDFLPKNRPTITQIVELFEKKNFRKKK